ncbi:MAG: hypothetical protein K8R99_08365 [Actinomycetia bacterium]|nr:hypothetical protein [Actinomycetes bacterium]
MVAKERIGWRWLLAVFAVAFVVYGASPVRQNYDSYLAFPTAQSILHDGNLSLNEFDTPMFDTHGWMSITDEGREVNTYPWVPSLALIPAVVALDVAHAVGIGPGSSSVANGGHMDVIQQLSASALMALVVVLVFVISFQRLAPAQSMKRRRAIAGVVAFGFAFGTAAWSTASRAMWQHGPSLLFLAIAVLCCQQLLSETMEGARLKWTAVCLGAAVAGSFTCRPTNAVAVLGFTAFVAFRMRKHLKRYLIGAFAIAAPWMMVNTANYGSPLPQYYRAGKVGWHDDYGLALATNLVSPARGLLLFSPIVVLGIFGVARRNRADVKDGLLDFDRLLIGLCLAYLLASSGPPVNWWAGHSFGPRFMSDTLIFFAAAATPTVALLMRQRRSAAAIAATLLLAWSVLVNAQGGAMRSTLCWNGNPDIDSHTSRLWDFGSSQMLSGVQAIFDDGLVDAIFTRCDTPAD